MDRADRLRLIVTSVPRLAAGLLLAVPATAQTVQPQTPAPPQALLQPPASAALLQPLLGPRQTAAQDVPAFLWWLSPAGRDAAGVDTLGAALAPAPGQWLAMAPGNGSAQLAVRHGRVRPALLLAGAPLPAGSALPLFDPDLLLAEGPTALGDGAAGTLALDLRRPGERLSGRLSGMGEFAAGGFGGRRALARLDLRAAKGLRLGLAGVLHHDLGSLTNTTTGERLNRQLRAGLAGMVDVDVIATLAWQLTVVASRNKAGNLPGFTCDPNDLSRCDGRFASTGQRADSANPWGTVTGDLASQPLGQRAVTALFASALSWRLGAVTVRLDQSLARESGQRGLDLADGRRLDALAVPAGLASGGYGLIARSRDTVEQHRLAIDADLGMLTLGGGAAVRHETRWRRQADTEAGTVLADRELAQHHREHSLFASARLTPATGLDLQAAVKLADNALNLSVSDLRPGCRPCLTPAGPPQVNRHLVTPEFAVGWRPGNAPGVLLFARSARTARLVGWNLLARDTAALAALPAETGWHHEAGSKLDLAGGRLRLNAAGFFAKTRSAVPALFDIDPLAAVQPADMTARGVNLAATARPLPALELAGTLTVQRVRWRGAIPAGAPARPLFAPDASASLSAAWRQELPGTGANLVPRLMLDWRSDMAVAAGDVLSPDGRGRLAGGIAPGGWQAGAALQMEIPDGGWLMSLECRNCLDRALVDGAVAGLPVLNGPRWWQLRFTRRF